MFCFWMVFFIADWGGKQLIKAKWMGSWKQKSTREIQASQLKQQEQEYRRNICFTCKQKRCGKKHVCWNWLCEFEGLLSNWGLGILDPKMESFPWGHHSDFLPSPLNTTDVLSEINSSYRARERKRFPLYTSPKKVCFLKIKPLVIFVGVKFDEAERVFFNPWQAQILWQTSRIIDGIMNYTTIQIPIVGYRCYRGKLWLVESWVFVHGFLGGVRLVGGYEEAESD